MAVYKTSFKQNAWSESDICNLRCVDVETKVAYKRVISGRCAKPGPDPAPGFFVSGVLIRSCNALGILHHKRRP
jgi:hypothetical protein